MSSLDPRNKTRLKKTLYVYRVINLKNGARNGEITSECSVVMESLTQHQTGLQVHSWRNFTKPSQSLHFSQRNRDCTHSNADSNGIAHLSKAAKRTINDELNSLYEYIAKPTDVQLMANERRGNSFTGYETKLWVPVTKKRLSEKQIK